MLRRFKTLICFLMITAVSSTAFGNSDYSVNVSQPSSEVIQVDYRLMDMAQDFTYPEEETIAITRWIVMPIGADPASIRLDAKNMDSQNADFHSFPEQSTGEMNQCFSVGQSVNYAGMQLVPVVFNPQTVNSSLESVSVRIEIPQTNEVCSGLSYEIAQAWGDLILNCGNPGRDEDDLFAQARYIYVVPRDQRVNEIIQPLVNLRSLEGFQVTVMPAFGTGEQILDSLQDMNAHGVPIEYVCLVGDVGGDFSVPTLSRGMSDYPYGLLEGSDAFPEAAVGRLSFNNMAELEGIVDKIISYELEPNLEDMDWIFRASVCAGNQRSGLSTILVNRWLRDYMFDHDFTEVDTLWYIMGGSIARFMEESFNRGKSFINYRGWTGLEDWSYNAAYRLDNDILPVALFLACNTGDYTGRGYGFTEALLRAEGGAIGAIGTAGSQSRVNYNNALFAGYYKGVLEDKVCRLGWTLNRARMELFAAYSAVSPERVSDHAYWTNLMGDPGTIIWLGVPFEVNMDFPDQINTGDGSFEVTVTDADNQPVQGVRVGLYQEDQFATASYTNAEGVAEILFEPNDMIGGNASLTVSGNRILRSTEQIRIIRSARAFIYKNYSVLDDDMDPRSGNGNSIINPFEVVELSVSVQNVGVTPFMNGANFRLATESEEIDIQNDFFVYEDRIDPNQIIQARFLILINSGFPHLENVPMTITARDNENRWDIDFNVQGQGAKWSVVDTEMEMDDPRPGDGAVSFWVDLKNDGIVDILRSEGTLRSLSNFAEVLNQRSLFDTLDVNEVETSESVYTISINQNTPWGASLPFVLDMVAENQYTGHSYFNIDIGQLPPNQPCPPDEYGYWAIDNIDFGNGFLTPTYNWTELDPQFQGIGRNTGLLDEGEDDDKSIVIDLPFDFQYYGEVFDKLTICTNGWAAFGEQADYVDFRNMSIGSPQGPRAQLCPWWDDLYMPDGTGGVFYYHDQQDHRFIVEWSRMRRYIGPVGPGASETFQLILLDTDWYPSSTGDGDIIFQYNSIANNAAADGHGTPYATVGIGNLDDTGGVEYCFWNKYAPGARTIVGSSAIRFATSYRFDRAVVFGTVTRHSDNAALSDVTIQVSPGGWAYSNDVGSYRVPSTIAGTPLVVRASAEGYNSVEVELDAINIGDSTRVLFSLFQPQLSVNVESITDTIRAIEIVQDSLRLMNNGDGVLDYSIRFDSRQEEFMTRRLAKYLPMRDEADEEWDRIYGFDITAQTNENRALGVFYTGETFYVSGGNNGESSNNIYLFNQDGNLVSSFPQPCEDSWGMHDLAWDGEAYYGGCRSSIYKMDLQGNIVGTINSPLVPPRGLAVEPESGNLWIANDSDPIYLLNRQGETIRTYNHNLNPYGLAFRPDDRDGYNLYIFSADGNTSMLISKLNPETGDIVTVREVSLDLGDRAGGCELTSHWSEVFWTLITVVQNPDGDRVEVFNAGLNVSWISAEPDAGQLESLGQAMIRISMDVTDLEDGEYLMDVVISHNAEGGELRVPLTLLYENELAGIEEKYPREYALEAVYPNPTNGYGLVKFSLPIQSMIKLTIIDASGRKIDELINNEYPAGIHSYSFYVNDLPSGIYFMKMEALNTVQTRKFVLLK